MALPTDYRGVACPVVTSFTDGELDENALADVVDWLVDSGVTGVMPAGTTGEFASLSDAEYERVVATTVEAADGRVPVFPGALATSVPRTLAHLETLADLGADAGVVTTPYFYTAKGPTGNERFLRAVADDAPLPLVFYNQPRFTGSTIAPETVRALATHENVVGLKDSGGDLGYFSKVNPSAAVRPPLVELTDAEREDVRSFLADISK
ncbi:MAG: dihydrodipicolinate synthase family protein [Haloarculaceae archaeon]